MITVLLVDDQELLRRGIRLLLEAVGGFEVVAEAADGREALAMITSHRPDWTRAKVGPSASTKSRDSRTAVEVIFSSSRDR